MTSVDSHSLEPDFDYDILEAALKSARDDDHLFGAIVNSPFTEPVPAAFIFLGIVVLLQVDKRTKTINRVALSETEMARQTTEVSAVPFNEIKIPCEHYENIIAHTIVSGEPSDTTDWKFLFEPAMSPEQARINQANAGIAYSAVYPLPARDGGAMIFSYYQYQHEIGIKQVEFMTRYAGLVNDALLR